MSYYTKSLALAFVFAGLLLFAPLGVHPIERASAQDPPEVPEVPEAPQAGLETGIFIIGVQEKGFARIEENGIAVFPVRFVDISIPSADLYTGAVQISCSIQNSTADVEDVRGWTGSFGLAGQIERNEEKMVNAQISTAANPEPNIFSMNVQCFARAPINKMVGNFTFTAQMEVFQRFSMQPYGPPPRVGPDDPVTVSVRITNNGNDYQRYVGEVDAPPGFQFGSPPSVLVPPGESKIVEIHGVTARDNIWYRPQMAPVKVTYVPEDGSAGEQTRTVGVIMGGLYFHPALVPFILLSLAAIVVLVMILIYARRTVEEQVFGKPVPPWRIPVEREYLKRLELEDPDEFYIVRYHLMVEEHQSAMLWYKYFKHATRKDRKLERKWLKVSEGVKARTTRVRARQERLEGRMARRLRVLPARRRRRLKALESELIAKQWKEQRRLLKVHDRSVSKIAKLHSKKEKKEKKKADAEFQKELKQAEKENKNRIKEGEVPLPLPEEPEWDYTEPELPDLVEVPLAAVDESVLAARSERLSRRFNKRIARRSAKAKKKMRKKGAKRDKKVAKLKKKIPKPPSTHLFDEDEYVSPDQVVVEDSRTPLQRALKIPPMETREALRRRRMVYKVKIQQAKQAGDNQRVERLKQEYAQERDHILGKDGGGEEKEDRQKAERPPSEEEKSSGGGGLRLLRKRRGGGDGGSAEAAADAAKEASKGRSSIGEGEDGA